MGRQGDGATQPDTVSKRYTVNIEIESSSSTSTDLDANCCDSSTCTKNTALGKSAKESKKTTTRKSRSKLHQTHEKLKDFLEKTSDVRLADDGKSMKYMLCGKNPKLDNSERSNSGHLKYFRRVHRCSVRAEVEGSESGDSESDEGCADDRIGFHMVMSTRAGRESVFTSRMRDFLQAR